jgi:hypothetical protein
LVKRGLKEGADDLAWSFLRCDMKPIKKTAYQICAITGVLALIVGVSWWVIRGNVAPSGIVNSSSRGVLPKQTSQDTSPLPGTDFLSGQEAAVMDRVAEGLPVEANPHRVVRTRVGGEDLATMVRNTGETWAVSQSLSFDAFVDAKSTEVLTRSFARNIRIKRLIELGLSNPEVGTHIARDLFARIESWEKTVMDFREADNQGKGGFAVADDGTRKGETASITFYEDQYAIPAQFFILANLGRQEVLPLAAQLFDRVKFVLLPDKFGNYPETNVRLHERLNLEIAYWAAVVVFPENNDERYAAVKKTILSKWSRDVICENESVPGSDALWNDNDIAVVTGRIDISSEPTVKLKVPALEKLSKVPEREKARVLKALAEADGRMPASADTLKP